MGSLEFPNCQDVSINIFHNMQLLHDRMINDKYNTVICNPILNLYVISSILRVSYTQENSHAKH